MALGKVQPHVARKNKDSIHLRNTETGFMKARRIERDIEIRETRNWERELDIMWRSGKLRMRG